MRFSIVTVDGEPLKAREFYRVTKESQLFGNKSDCTIDLYSEFWLQILPLPPYAIRLLTNSQLVQSIVALSAKY